MIRKLLLIAAIAAGMTFAQSESTQSYTAAQPKTERPETAQAAPEADPAWNVSIHPASLVVFSALGLRSLYVDVERSTSAHTSITVTPNVVYFNSDYYDNCFDGNWTWYNGNRFRVQSQNGFLPDLGGELGHFILSNIGWIRNDEVE